MCIHLELFQLEVCKLNNAFELSSCIFLSRYWYHAFNFIEMLEFINSPNKCSFLFQYSAPKSTCTIRLQGWTWLWAVLYCRDHIWQWYVSIFKPQYLYYIWLVRKVWALSVGVGAANRYICFVPTPAPQQVSEIGPSTVWHLTPWSSRLD